MKEFLIFYLDCVPIEPPPPAGKERYGQKVTGEEGLGIAERNVQRLGHGSAWV
jgi:hypothetical protein